MSKDDPTITETDQCSGCGRGTYLARMIVCPDCKAKLIVQFAKKDAIDGIGVNRDNVGVAEALAELDDIRDGHTEWSVEDVREWEREAREALSVCAEALMAHLATDNPSSGEQV